MNQVIRWWQHLPEQIDPVFLKLGSLEIRYYGLMWVLAILTAYLLTHYRLRHDSPSFTRNQIDHAFSWMILGAILGGRLGYVLFYDFGYYLRHPLEIFLPLRTDGGLQFAGIAGLSYHGGLIGVTAGLFYSCRKLKLNFWKFSGFLIPQIPAGYTFGRLGNFLNGELWGRATSIPWGMYFPNDMLHQLRHPSQLYEAFFEGVFLFVVFWSFRNKPLIKEKGLPFYLIGYGIVRFFIEFFREPDIHLGFVTGFLTMGQLLCLGMIIIGIIFVLMLGNLKPGKAAKKNRI
ncbi:MAG: prolipoprotein diacylglyceryl transferase [Candidatus Omnitrophica bacterium CG12_big_fil_rev_8_21_14_0_65_45_16]|nr:MAG: prolipoprotein diacylglyceryl transferase [Candidatus Omnitrophica bacterium CG12_big_fil_rev_8_21_14_0_65_45_16]